MPLMQLAQPQWQSYLDRISRALSEQRAQVEAAALGIGNHAADHWIALKGLWSDPKDDVLIVSGEGLEYLIRHPRRLEIDHELHWLHSIDVVDADGKHHIMQLMDPISLPVP
jgi:hypothetical protein